MKKLLITLAMAMTNVVMAKETITIITPAAASQSSTPLTLKMIERANEAQNKYNFVADFRPGGNGIVALKYMDSSPQNRLSIVAPAFIENAKTGMINEDDYVPVHASGDVCWSVIANVGNSAQGLASLADLKGQEITVGGVGFGNATHITSLLLAERYGFRVKYIVFRSNFDAVVNMAGDNGVNMALESVNTYNQFKQRQPRLQALGFNCTVRSEPAPELKTLREQGVNAPMVFNITMANRAMPEAKRREIAEILETATRSVGAKEHADVAGLYPPVFAGVSAEEFARRRIGLQKQLVQRFEKQIEASK